MEVKEVILEGIRRESEQVEMREVDQLKLTMYQNVLRKPIVYMLIRKWKGNWVGIIRCYHSQFRIRTANYPVEW